MPVAQGWCWKCHAEGSYWQSLTGQSGDLACGEMTLRKVSYGEQQQGLQLAAAMGYHDGQNTPSLSWWASGTHRPASQGMGWGAGCGSGGSESLVSPHRLLCGWPCRHQTSRATQVRTAALFLGPRANQRLASEPELAGPRDTTFSGKGLWLL